MHPGPAPTRPSVIGERIQYHDAGARPVFRPPKPLFVNSVNQEREVFHKHSMTDTHHLLGELNHRIQNNFQIIVSLMNLKKRLLPQERRDDIRFIEEHVHSMAVAYRLVYATGAMNEGSVSDLLGEIVSELRLIARLNTDQVHLDGTSVHGMMGLDQAISFGLYLAVVLPPYLDSALDSGGLVSICAGVDRNFLTLAVASTGPQPEQPDCLRLRLSEAYAGQLQAENLSPPDKSELRIRFHLDHRRSTITRSWNGNAVPGTIAQNSL